MSTARETQRQRVAYYKAEQCGRNPERQRNSYKNYSALGRSLACPRAAKLERQFGIDILDWHFNTSFTKRFLVAEDKT